MKYRYVIDIVKKDHKGVYAYLYSKEIYDWLVKSIIFYDDDKVEALVESKTSNERYWVYIDLKRDIYFCTCNAWTFKHYNIQLPEDKIFWRRDIVICPHILKVLQVIDKIKSKNIRK